MAVTPVDVGGSIAKGLQINALKQQMRDREEARQSRNALKSIYAERFGGTDPQSGITWETGRQGPGAMNDQQFVGRVSQVDPALGLDWSKHFAGQDAAKLERQKAEAPLFAAALEGVQDQAGYDKARQLLTQQGLDVSDMPPQYDPATTNMVVQGSKYLAGISSPKPPAPTNLSKLIAERDALPEGDPRRATYNDAISKASTNPPPAQTNVTVGGGKYGTIPQGYQLIETEQGARLVPIPGGPAAEEIAAAEEAKKAGQKGKETTANIVVEDIDRVFDIMDSSALPVAGFGSWASAVPGTPQHDVARLVDTVRANVGFDKLQAMREASPTGGALGQVSENENRLLQSVLGNLEQSQSPEQFRRNLERVKEVFQDIVHGVGNRPTAEREAVTIGGQTYSMEDLQFTAEKHNMTVDEVIERLKSAASR